MVAPPPFPVLKTKFQTKSKVAAAKKAKKQSFRAFIKQVDPRYRFYRHCDVLIDRLQDVADGKIKRLMIFLPPRHGKSKTATQLFPAYFLSRYPDWWVSISSYAADLAYTHSRLARDIYKEAGGICRDDTDAVKQWATEGRGGLFASGVGGPLTGRGFFCGIIDDPLKNAEQAASETIRNKQKEWYESTFYTREEPWSETDPNGAIVLIMTRWNADDLAGWLLKQEEDEDAEAHEKWHVIALEAIKEEEPYKIPKTCTIEPDWRSPGEALCPERRPIEKLHRIAKKIGSYFFRALFQQSPKDLEGSIVKKEWFKYYGTAPAHPTSIIQSWDTAQKANELADFSVCTTWAVTSTGYYLLDVYRKQVGSPDLIKDAINLGTKWKPNVVLVEDKGSGTGLIQHLKRSTTLSVFPINPTQEKMVRFSNEAPAIEAGNVFLPEVAPWLLDYEDEMTAAPNGVKDDQCDSTSQFLGYIREHGAKKGASRF
jgi:predicted phage terminase large subunit-like protein